MTTSTTASPADLLTQVAGQRQTGALVVGGHPGGAVYVFEGHVIYAESPAAPGVGELLTSSGRLAARTWQHALDQGSATARVGRLLVEQGHLTLGELELCVLGTIYDAAYFALTADRPQIEFLHGAMHWLGPVVAVDAGSVSREVRRRARLLHEIFPDGRVDTTAVTPVPRPPLERITLSALQWELLVHADGQRTPADLALLLGRAGFATVQELRRLAAAGLLELPEVRPTAPAFVRLPRARGTAVAVHRPVNGADATAAGSEPRPLPAAPSSETTQAIVVGPRPALSPARSSPAPSSPAPSSPASGSPAPSSPASGFGAVPTPDPGGGTIYRPPRLARRKPGAKLPKELAGEKPPAYPGTDEVLLRRIRTALRALR